MIQLHLKIKNFKKFILKRNISKFLKIEIFNVFNPYMQYVYLTFFSKYRVQKVDIYESTEDKKKCQPNVSIFFCSITLGNSLKKLFKKKKNSKRSLSNSRGNETILRSKCVNGIFVVPRIIHQISTKFETKIMN